MKLKGELGDLMLHMVFYSKIASETNDFDVADVLNTVCDKLVERHPHIYGDVLAEQKRQVKENWEKIKLKKGKNRFFKECQSHCLQWLNLPVSKKKQEGVGFDWDNKEQVFEKVKEEFSELHEEVEKNDVSAIEDEFGDVLFSMINYARFIGVDPEMALERTNKKFIKRFQYLEAESKKDGKEMGEMTLDEMDEYWNKAKKL